ncbi:MAG: leucyl aminopeptidase [Polyangiales bacterium]
MKIELSRASGEKAAQFAVDVLVVAASASRAKAATPGKAVKKGQATAALRGPWAPNATLDAIDAALGGALVAQAAREEFSGKPNSALVLNTLGRIGARTIVVVGLGDGRTKPPTLRSLAARGARIANGERARTLAVVAPDAQPETLRALAEGVLLGAYRFARYLTGDRIPKHELDSATILVDKDSAAARDAVKLGEAIGRAVCLTRDLVTEPPNVLNAPVLADRAREVAKAGGLKIQVFDKAEIARRKMWLLLAVNQGSTIEPRFVHMTYTPPGAKAAKAGGAGKKGAKPGKATKKLVFVGKGLTFDSGGLCIKPADGMIDMKIDMSGAANVVGLMTAVAALKPNIEVHGIFASTDNMPDGNAYRPGDVFPSLDGKFVEIINTDAEGRLVLADALAYARALEPDLIVDNATLTGACMVALGNSCSGFYSNRDDLAKTFKQACDDAGEQMWRMPLLEDLRDQLKSEVADLKHLGSRYGGSITAALFLREFVGDVPWIHCDIAGPVVSDKAVGFYVKGATGHGVLSFLELIEKMAR